MLTFLRRRTSVEKKAKKYVAHCWHIMRPSGNAQP